MSEQKGKEREEKRRIEEGREFGKGGLLQGGKVVSSGSNEILKSAAIFCWPLWIPVYVICYRDINLEISCHFCWPSGFQCM